MFSSYKIEESKLIDFHQTEHSSQKSIELSSFPNAVQEISNACQAIIQFYQQNDDKISGPLEYLNSFYIEKSEEILNDNIDLSPILSLYQKYEFGQLFFHFFHDYSLSDEINLFVTHLALILRFDIFLSYLKQFDLFQYIFPRLLDFQGGNWTDISFVVYRLFECQYQFEETYRILFEDFFSLSDLIFSKTNDSFYIYKLTDLIVSTVKEEYQLPQHIKSQLFNMYQVIIDNIVRFPIEHINQFFFIYQIFTTIVTFGPPDSFRLLYQTDIFEILLSDPNEDSKELRLKRIDFVTTCLNSFPPAAANQFLVDQCQKYFTFSMIIECLDSGDFDFISPVIRFYKSFLPNHIDFLSRRYSFKAIIGSIQDFFLNGDYASKIDTLELINLLIQNHPIFLRELIKQNLIDDDEEEDHFDCFATLHDLIDEYEKLEISKRVVAIINSIIVTINKHPHKKGLETFKEKFDRELSHDFVRLTQSSDPDLAEQAQWILNQILYDDSF